MSNNDGMNYAPKGKSEKVVQDGEFKVGIVGLDHGHIYGMSNGLKEAGAQLTAVYDEDSEKVEAFIQEHPEVKKADSEESVLNDAEIQMIAGAKIPSQRGDLGLRVLDAGKHYFTDKTPFTTKEQLDRARKKVDETGLRWFVYYSERLHVESAVYAGDLIKSGEIGDVVQVLGTGPHRSNIASRPEWFWQREHYGGILCDIASHQVEQFLFYAGADDAKVIHSKVGNYAHKDYPEFEDFGDATLTADNGASNYFRVDWLTPDGLGTWGDGRTIILGTKGYIELRKYVDIAKSAEEDHVYVVNDKEERYENVSGQIGYPFFGEMILDCLNQTEKAMTQAHIFKAAELALDSQEQALKIN
ncbi:Gfo/Idh/MocA family protein [Salibacterium lacus]|uniref:Gfo/Idh/MocA family protein n=1 Tax=Salibacterium lacus TaxID=1898109 RepID=A0ABW5T7I6_9BACI